MRRAATCRPWSVRGVVVAVLLLVVGGCSGPAPAPVDPAEAERSAALLAEAETDPSVVLFTVLPTNANRYSPDDLTAEAGPLDLVMDNQTLLPHNVVFEDVVTEDLEEGDRAVNAPGTGVFSGEIELDAGTYTFYCDIPGHRNQGMEGTLTVG